MVAAVIHSYLLVVIGAVGSTTAAAIAAAAAVAVAAAVAAVPRVAVECNKVDNLTGNRDKRDHVSDEITWLTFTL